MESKKVVTSGPITPSTINSPLDFRTRVNTVDEIYNIDLPFIGMIVYVIDEDKYYKIKTLKSKEIGLQLIEDAAVDTFEEFIGRIKSENLQIELGSGASARDGNIALGEAAQANASGMTSIAIGWDAQANASSAVAIGPRTKVDAYCSFAMGNGTVAKGKVQHVIGSYNKPDTKSIFIVGNGVDSGGRKNAHTIDETGNAWFQGDVFIKGTSQDDGQKLATEDTVIALQQEIAELRVLIEELKNNELPLPGEDPEYEFVSPEIVKVDDFFSYIIASGYNSNDLSVWSEAVADKNITGLIIRPDVQYCNLSNVINFFLSTDYMNNEYYIKNNETDEEESFTKICKIDNVHLNIETGNDYLDKILNEDDQKGHIKCEQGSELHEQVMSTFIRSNSNYWVLEGTGAKCNVSMDLIVRYAPPVPTDIYRTIKVTYSMYL